MEVVRELRRLGAAAGVVALAAMIFATAASAARVALFLDPAYVDTTSGATSAEGETLRATLTAQKHKVKTFTGVAAGDFSKGLAGTRLLVIPEREVADLTPALSAQAAHTLRNYVASGGGVILISDHSFGSPTDSAALLNRLFGFQLTEANTGQTSTLQQALVPGTAFAGAPAALPSNDGQTGLLNLPGGAVPVYVDGGGRATVALFGIGEGTVVFLGWDWFDAAPLGAQDDGWLGLLRRAVREAVGVGCTITGTPGADFLNGTSGNDVICARGGSDNVNAARGHDVVLAGKGDDLVRGGKGNDALFLGAGADRGLGGPGNDRIDGGPGPDVCVQGPGRGRLARC